MIRRLLDWLVFLLYAWLIADDLHRFSHAPYRCSDDCAWPWGERRWWAGLLGSNVEQPDAD